MSSKPIYIVTTYGRRTRSVLAYSLAECWMLTTELECEFSITTFDNIDLKTLTSKIAHAGRSLVARWHKQGRLNQFQIRQGK